MGGSAEGVATGNPWLSFLVLSGMLGAVIGSFLNVVSYRLPRAISIVSPGSACPSCEQPIRPWHNIPILSWLWLRGRCHSCGSSFSVRYALVEAAGALLWVLLYLHFVPDAGALQDGPQPLIPVLVYGGYFSALLAISLIDADHFIVPDVISLPLIPLGITAIALLDLAGISEVSLPGAVAGAIVGALSMLALAGFGRVLFGREALGMGDVKLVAAIGAWQGAHPTLLLTVFVASLMGSVVGISYMVVRGRQRHLKLPFGPYLCGGALAAWLWGEEVVSHLLGT
jgi:leader peptidase (prepilin peptidase)/N-methyltransferase